MITITIIGIETLKIAVKLVKQPFKKLELVPSAYQTIHTQQIS